MKGKNIMAAAMYIFAFIVGVVAVRFAVQVPTSIPGKIVLGFLGWLLGCGIGVAAAFLVYIIVDTIKNP